MVPVWSELIDPAEIEMIRIGKMTDYGIVLLSYFVQDEKKAHNARDLSIESRLPLPTVSKILKGLSRAELLVSQRGVKGGYRLAFKPDAISVATIIQALEGPIAMTECSSHGPELCNIEALCPVKGNWRKINAVVSQALQNLSLADMSRPLTRTVASRGISP